MTVLRKSAILAISFVVGLAATFASYEYFYEGLTPWQKLQDISFEQNTGATKFEARVKASTIGLAAWGGTACMILLGFKIFGKNNSKGAK